MTPPQEFSLRLRIDLLMAVCARLAQRDCGELSAVGWMLLAPRPGGLGHRGGFSELNNDGGPVQACVSHGPGGATTRLLIDPAWYLNDPHARFEASELSLRRALVLSNAASLSTLADTLVDTMLPADPQLREAYPSSFLWLAVGVGRPGCAAYVDVRPLGDAAWAHLTQWLQQALPDPTPALRTLDILHPHITLSSVGFEGDSPERGRVKVYWRLRQAVSLSALGVGLFNDPLLAAFIASTVGQREMPLSGIVMSAGFDLASGELEDVKIDLCAHCIPLTPAEWVMQLRTLSQALGVSRATYEPDLLARGCEVAFVGMGITKRGEPRMNVYLKPSGLEAGALSERLLRERIARAAAYLCDLQQADGAFADYRLPVGQATHWVTAFTGLALAEAGKAADLPWATAAAQAAAQSLLEARDYPAGWGYNETTGTDSDSTGFAIRLLRATGHLVTEADKDSLLQRWHPDGGFATYDGPGAWGHTHPCVTAAAYQALDAADRQRLLPALRSCLARTANADGTWPSYWWRTHHYSTWHHLVLLRRLGLNDEYIPLGDGAETAGSDDDALPHAFELAYAAGIAAFRAPGSARAQRLLRDLLAAQRVDGGFSGSHSLRVTEPSCEKPWIQPTGSLYQDRAGSITTASALFVLSEILRA